MKKKLTDAQRADLYAATIVRDPSAPQMASAMAVQMYVRRACHYGIKLGKRLAREVKKGKKK